MAKTSTIQWTDATWNIAVGCTKVDEDCKYCYMYRQSLNNTRYDPKHIRKTKSVFNLPLKYNEKKSKCWAGAPLIFTSSLTDVFHPAIDPFRIEMWDIIRQCPHLTFQILTKRPERIMDNLPPDWGDGWDNVWLGTSVGGSKGKHRIRELIKIRHIAKTLFLSLEPLHAPVDLGEYYFSDRLISNVPVNSRTKLIHLFDWVIVGGESGNENGRYKYRPCDVRWIQNIIYECQSANVPVFIKQMGTHIAKANGYKDRHGGDIDEWPAQFQIRQFPKTNEQNNI